MFNSHAVMHSVVLDNNLPGSGSVLGSGHTDHTHVHANSHYHSHGATSQQPLPTPPEQPTHDMQQPAFHADNIQPATTTTSHIDSATSLSGGGNVENTHHGFEPLTILAQEVNLI